MTDYKKLSKEWEEVAKEKSRLINSMKDQAARLGITVVTDENGIWFRKEDDSE